MDKFKKVGSLFCLLYFLGSFAIAENEQLLIIQPIKHYYWIQVADTIKLRVLWQGIELKNHPVFLKMRSGEDTHFFTDNQGMISIRIPHIDKKMFKHRYDYVVLNIWTKKNTDLDNCYTAQYFLKVHPQRYGGVYWKDAKFAVGSMIIIFFFLGWQLKKKLEDIY